MSRPIFLKRIVLLAALLLSFCATGAVAFAEDAADARFLFVSGKGGVTLTGYLGSADALTVPEQLGGQPVVAVGSGAFWGNTTLQSVWLPASVTTLDDYAFAGCTALRDLQAPGVTAIGDYALYGCDALSQVMLGVLATVGEQAFGNVRPSISVPIVAGLAGYLDTHAVLEETIGKFATGSVGYLAVTDGLLPLYERLLAQMRVDLDVDSLWEQHFDLYFSACKASGLYDVLTPDERVYVDGCLDAMLRDLAADAARLAAAG